MEPYHGASRRHGRHPGMHAQLRGLPCRQPPDGKAGDPPLAQPHPDDRLSDGQLETIGREYMEKLGYGDQPYIIFRHEDNARPHIHIVSLRIDEQGRKIRDYKEWERSMKICRELEQKYELVPSTKEERKTSGAMTAVEYRKGDLKHQIANVVRPALQDYRFRSFREFKALLGLFNVTVEEVRKSVDGRTCHGLVYAALDEKGRRCGVGIKLCLYINRTGFNPRS